MLIKSVSYAYCDILQSSCANLARKILSIIAGSCGRFASCLAQDFRKIAHDVSTSEFIAVDYSRLTTVDRE